MGRNVKLRNGLIDDYSTKWHTTVIFGKIWQPGLKLMKDLAHPNIVTLYDVFECDNKLHLVMEYCDKGDLRDRISAKKMKKRLFNYSLIRRWMLQLTKVRFVLI